jgi:hypothetical protein
MQIIVQITKAVPDTARTDHSVHQPLMCGGQVR